MKNKKGVVVLEIKENPLEISSIEVKNLHDGLNFVMVGFKNSNWKYDNNTDEITVDRKDKRVVGVISDMELKHFEEKYGEKGIITYRNDE